MKLFFTVLMACISNQLIARMVDRLQLYLQLRKIGRTVAVREHVHREQQVLMYVDLTEQTTELQRRWNEYIDGRLQLRKIVINDQVMIEASDWDMFLHHIGVI